MHTAILYQRRGSGKISGVWRGMIACSGERRSQNLWYLVSFVGEKGCERSSSKALGFTFDHV